MPSSGDGAIAKESVQAKPERGRWSVVPQVLGWGVVLAGGGYCLADRRDAATITAVCTVGLVMVVVAQLDKLDALKALGIEVKVRQIEAARVEVEEALRAAEGAKVDAEAARDYIREVAAEMTSVTLQIAAGTGVWDGGDTTQAKLEKRDRLRALLEKIGASSTQVATAVAPFDEFVRVTLATQLVGAVANLAGPSVPLNAQIRSLANFRAREAPRAETIAAVMKTHGLTSDETEARLAVLRRFEASGTLPADVAE